MLKKNILHISPNFNFACGVSKHVFILLSSSELKKEYNLHFITNGGDALQKLKNAQINYSLINFKTDKYLHFDLFGKYSLIKKYCIDKNINIIHTHHRYPALLAFIIANSLDIKTVVTVHNFVRRFKHLSYKADKIISVSNSVKSHLHKYFKLPESKIDVLYNCIAKEDFKEFNSSGLKSTLNIPAESKVILYTGRLIEEKGIRCLVNAFNMISQEFMPAELVLVGENKLPSKLISKILSNPKIHFLPSRENVNEFYQISDVVVLPSQKEPLGYTMLEAGLFKIPFIGSRAGGIAEFIEDGVNGYLFEPENADNLAGKIEYVLTHLNEALVTANKLHEKVTIECNCEKYFNKLVSIYSTLLND